MKLKLGFVAISIFLFFSGYNQESVDLNSLIPASGEINNWVMKDSAEIYSNDDLYLYIDGGADLYLEYGFDKVISSKYIDPKASKIHIEIYEMDSSPDAFGVYSINSSAIGKNINIGTEGILYDYYLHFWKSKYYVRCTSTVKEQGVIDTLLIFAKFIDDHILIPGKKPQIVQALNLKDQEVTHIKYFKGQIALGNVFNFSHGSVAGFDEGVYGKFDDRLIFVFSYSDERARREWFASLKGKMNMSKLFSDYTAMDDGFTVKDRVGTILSFKPFGRYYCVIKGMNWEESQKIFREVENNVNAFN